ncbi:ribonuclease D [Paraglaciecola aestuariivivens]
MQYSFITTNQALADYCLQAKQASAIAVDTEFVRTRTLYPKLGLIQIYDGQQLVLIDPLAIDDFSSLTALLTDPQVVKVLHSCSEDLETFWHAFKVMPSPIFDSQFAASLLGMGPALGYAKLVETMLTITVDKGESRTDWLARPLREEQCDYAAKDVLYLLQLYPSLTQQIEQQGRLNWVYTEMEHLAQKKRLQPDAESVYLSMKNTWKLSGKALLVFKKLAAWRIQTARQRDLALNFVVREENLFTIAQQQPKNKQALAILPGINAHEVRIHGDALLKIVQDCQQAQATDYPARVNRLNDIDGYKNVVSKVKKVCTQQAELHQLPVELLGSKKQVNQLLKWCWFNESEYAQSDLLPDLVSHWRGEILIKELAKIAELNLPSQLTGEQH